MKSSLVAWGVIFFQFLVMLPLRCGVWDLKGRVTIRQNSTIFEMLLSYLTVGFVAYSLCFFFIMILLTWRNYVIGFWTELSGKTWLRYGYPIGSIALYIGADVFLSRGHPSRGYPYGEQVGPSPAQWLAIIWGVNVIRLFLAVILIRRQLQSGVLKPQTLQRGAILGSLLFGCLMAAVWFCTTESRIQLTSPNYLSAFYVTCLVVGLTLLWTPIVRILLATEMLHQNRHRPN